MSLKNLHKPTVDLPESTRKELEKVPHKRLTIDIPETLHQKLKILAAEKNTTIRKIIITSVNKEIKNT